VNPDEDASRQAERSERSDLEGMPLQCRARRRRPADPTDATDGVNAGWPLLEDGGGGDELGDALGQFGAVASGSVNREATTTLASWGAPRARFEAAAG